MEDDDRPHWTVSYLMVAWIFLTTTLHNLYTTLLLINIYKFLWVHKTPTKCVLMWEKAKKKKYYQEVVNGVILFVFLVITDRRISMKR